MHAPPMLREGVDLVHKSMSSSSFTLCFERYSGMSVGKVHNRWPDESMGILLKVM